MCQSQADGGKRCAAHSVTGTARRTLKNNLDQQIHAKNAAAAFETVRTLARLDKARDLYGNVVTPMNMALPREVHRVFAVITGAGFRPLVVGGSVRDALSDGRTPKDIDVEVYGASIDEVAATLRSTYRVDEVGKSFGVLKVVLPDGTDLDVSVPRRDNHVGAGHRGFTVETDATMTATEAAARRDFTLNAMGYDPEFEVCVDPYGGRADLQAGILRATSDAFAEDPLRVLRGFQFAARYGWTLDGETAATCRALVDRAVELPVERVRGEWRKFYTKGNHPEHGLTALAMTGWDATVPGLASVNTPTVRAQVHRAVATSEAAGFDGDARQRLVAATLSRSMDPRTARAFIWHTIEGADQQRAAYGLSRAECPAHVDADVTVRGWAHGLGATHTSVREWARLETVTGNSMQAAAVVAAAERLGCADAPQPDLILGRDIISRFPERKPGPWVGQIQRAARQAQIDGVFATREQATHWLAAQAADM